MINKIMGIFKTKPDKQKYKSPYDVPKYEHCDVCVYDCATCDGISCFTGMMKGIELDKNK